MKQDVKQLLELIDAQIADHERALTHLRKMRNVWSKYELPEVQIIERNTPLTRELIRKFMKNYKDPVQTTQVIGILYSDKNEEDKYNLTKHLSVIFNQMSKSGEVIATKREGVKGNFFTWNNNQ